MKKAIAIITLVASMSFTTSAFASGQDVAKCSKMKHVSKCSQNMNGVSECATSTSCPMSSMQCSK